ncbi:MAG: hypothetical protein AAGJ29_00430 [Pseudomonadota bacterium]
MSSKQDEALYAVAKDILLRSLLKDSDIHERLNDEEYRAAFRLMIGNALHDRYDFSSNTQSPEAIAEEILDAVIDVIKVYRRS